MTGDPFVGITEAAWQRTVVEAAGYLGWQCYHTAFSVRSAPGFPDLVCVRPGADGAPGRMVALELKRERGKATAAQERWIGLFAAVPGVAAMVARPSDWPTVEALLRGEADGAGDPEGSPAPVRLQTQYGSSST